MPFTTMERTAVDLLAGRPWDEARSLWGWIVSHEVSTLAELAASIDRRVARAGTAQLRRLALVSRTGAISPAEDVLHVILRTAGLSGWEANVSVYSVRRAIERTA